MIVLQQIIFLLTPVERCSYTRCADAELNCPTLAGGCCLRAEYKCNGFEECQNGLDEQDCQQGNRVFKITQGQA